MAVKHMIINELPTTKILVIDPEDEYSYLCNNLKGKVISCDGTKNGGILNPLQVRISKDDEMGRKLQDMNLMTRKRASGRRK